MATDFWMGAEPDTLSPGDELPSGMRISRHVTSNPERWGELEERTTELDGVFLTVRVRDPVHASVHCLDPAVTASQMPPDGVAQLGLHPTWLAGDLGRALRGAAVRNTTRFGERWAWTMTGEHPAVEAALVVPGRHQRCVYLELARVAILILKLGNLTQATLMASAVERRLQPDFDDSFNCIIPQ